ncbi:hypothetical protein [Candidatus Mycoplasma haematominutum]|uniref:hypothetical protein n=1 Tax=Candidatus Mycoplasma haematominutum TaxID=209446 RepID=UPI00030636A9|nr:hypothetical protein [Candidatus Mycoplasma haematominutum]
MGGIWRSGLELKKSSEIYSEWLFVMSDNWLWLVTGGSTIASPEVLSGRVDNPKA